MTATAALARWVAVGTDLLYPRRCAGCASALPPGAAGELCAGCAGALPAVERPWCVVCGEPFAVPSPSDEERFADRTCARCRDERPAFAAARAALRHEGASREVLHAFKFGGRRELAATLAGLVEARLREEPELLYGLDAVVPVPLHAARLRERGYNQAELLARALAVRLELPCRPEWLARIRATASQVGLDRTHRRENVHGAFAVPRPEEVGDQVILLVDDVLTTGATADAAARALRRAGAAAVRVAAAARG